MVRMLHKQLTKLRMYGSKLTIYRNVYRPKRVAVRKSKNAFYEIP